MGGCAPARAGRVSQTSAEVRLGLHPKTASKAGRGAEGERRRRRREDKAKATKEANFQQQTQR